MSENTNHLCGWVIIILGAVVLLFIIVFWGIPINDTEITGAHAFGLYHIEPFFEKPETLTPGLGSTTPILRSNIYATGISKHHAQQTVALSIFSIFSQTPFREPVRFFIPFMFTAFCFLSIFRFAKKEKPESAVPKKIREYLSKNSGASLSEIVQETHASRGSVVHHLRRLVHDHEVSKILLGKRFRYSNAGNDQDVVSLQKEPVTKHPTAEKILAYLETHTDVSRKQIGADLHIPLSVVYWHLSRMETLHLITRKKSGRSFTYSLNKK